jgi:hypothetical protein
MSYNMWILLVIFAAPFLVIAFRGVIPRIKMLRQANVLLKKIPTHESKTLYINFSSFVGNGKQREMDAKITEMAKEGWVYLKANEVNPMKTLFSWGGGLNMHFIRNTSKDEHTNS